MEIEYFDYLKGGVTAAMIVASLLVERGTEETSNGSYMECFESVGDMIPADEAMIKEIASDVKEILEEKFAEQVAEVEVNDDGFDIMFYLDYCPNLDRDAYIDLYPYLDQDLRITHEQAKELDEVLDYMYGHHEQERELEDLYEEWLNDIEAYGVPLADDMDETAWRKFMTNALRHLQYECGMDNAMLAEAFKEGALRLSYSLFEPCWGCFMENDCYNDHTDVRGQCQAYIIFMERLGLDEPLE